MPYLTFSHGICEVAILAILRELLPHHTSDEIATFHRVLATLINTLPEGDDLWEQLGASWDHRLDQLRSLTETTDEKG